MAQHSVTLFIKVIAGCLTALLSSCATSPSDVFSNRAQGYGFEENIISTPQFDLTIYTNPAFKNSIGDPTLHIYIGGDGQPFFRNQYIAPDPTSKRALTLELMSLDSSPSIYIGRPCYHSSGARNCGDSKWWTSHRYNERVIDAIQTAIAFTLNAKPRTQITLIGFSGGGTLAILLAPLVDDLSSVVTINPNLNVDAWTRHHGYAPLNQSVNPATQPNLPRHVTKHYLLGEQDSNVLSTHWLDRFQNQANSYIHRYTNYNHICCWPKMWAEFLREKIIEAAPLKTEPAS